MENMRQMEPHLVRRTLLEIPQPPETVYARGTLPDPDLFWITVVGSRKATSYGRDVVNSIVRGLSGYPVVIVSGLALGLDALAHRAALDAGLPTVAIPGSGLADSVLAPRTNVWLAHEIINSGGALLSEYTPETEAALYTFPKRNRIMAGISDAVLVVEAGVASGTLVTARLALEYNKTVFAVPGSIFSPNSAGPHHLLNQGARPATSAEDVLAEFGIKAREKKNVEREYTDVEGKIISLLRGRPHSRDEIIASLGLGAGDIAPALISLELDGVTREEFGEISLA